MSKITAVLCYALLLTSVAADHVVSRRDDISDIRRREIIDFDRRSVVDQPIFERSFLSVILISPMLCINENINIVYAELVINVSQFSAQSQKSQ